MKISITCNEVCLVKGQMLLCPDLKRRGAEPSLNWVQGKEEGNNVSAMWFCKTATKLLCLESWGTGLEQCSTVYSSQSIKSKINSKHRTAGRGKARISCSICTAGGSAVLGLVPLLLLVLNESTKGITAAWKPCLLPEKRACWILCNENFAGLRCNSY